jgi:hypothetical protein
MMVYLILDNYEKSCKLSDDGKFILEVLQRRSGLLSFQAGSSLLQSVFLFTNSLFATNQHESAFVNLERRAQYRSIKPCRMPKTAFSLKSEDFKMVSS